MLFFVLLVLSRKVERDRGITVKAQTASMLHDGHLLNLIDTPGHVDFSYEVIWVATPRDVLVWVFFVTEPGGVV